MPFWVYMLRCADDSIYVGHSDQLERRLLDHQSGLLGGYTASRLPVRLVFTQEFPSRDEALGRERQIGNWSRAKKEALAAGDWERLKHLAEGGTRRRRPEMEAGRPLDFARAPRGLRLG